MDHRYIDEQAVPGRYLDHALAPAEREEFEKHLVDCQECMDRLLLAGMFHAREAAPNNQPAQVEIAREAALAIPLRARFVARFKPWELVVLFAVMAALLLAIPTAYFLWQLYLMGRHQ